MKRRFTRRVLTAIVVMGVVLPFVGISGAGAESGDEVYTGQNGAQVVVHRGQGCANSTMNIDSGMVSDPTPNLVSSLVVDVDANCNVKISSQHSGVPAQPDGQGPASSIQIGSPLAAPTSASPSFEASNLYGNYIRSSQTLQDVVNIDIGKWEWTHDRVWDDYYAVTRFKSAGEDGANYVWWGQASTSVTWNHPVGASYDGADVTYCSLCTAHSYSHGTFHSDFLWCNFQPGQDFNLYTTLDSTSGGWYDAHFTQSALCSGTHMATDKYTSITPPPF